MKIIQLSSQNVKRLTAVEITPKGSLVQIAGANGAGKTSILDSIFWALAGTASIQGDPVRHGADEARIKLRLGPTNEGDELVVRRIIRKGEDGHAVTHQLFVETPTGAKYPRPQEKLDALIGKLTLDPVAFQRMKPAEQFETLKTFVPGVDFDAYDDETAEDYKARAELNRQAKDAETVAGTIVIDESVPEELIDVDALLSQALNAGHHNAGIVQERGRRAALGSKTEEHRAKAKELRRRADALREDADKLEAQADDQVALADGIADGAKALPALAEEIDARTLELQVREARGINEKVNKRKERAELFAKAIEIKARAKALTDRMDARELEKQRKIEAAQMPIPSLGFGTGFITLGGVPFEQASDAEQLRTSIALAMALNPTLRIIRVRDGSLLDEHSLKMVEEMASEKDFQIWLEFVDSSGSVGIVIEDGRVKGQTLAATEEPEAPKAKRTRAAT